MTTTTSQMNITVAIVEDDAGFRESLAMLINGAEGFRCVSTHPNAETALKQLPSRWPDVVLMDINLPQMSGIECVAKLKEMRPALQVVMLTAYMENEKIFDSMMVGATGYLLKKTPLHKSWTPSPRFIAVVHRCPPRSRARWCNTSIKAGNQRRKWKNLSPREQEVLALASKGYQYKRKRLPRTFRSAWKQFASTSVTFTKNSMSVPAPKRW